MKFGKGGDKGPVVLSITGFTYLIVMFSIVLIGLSLTGAVQEWKIIMKREREAELLFRGDQIRQAIARYYTLPSVRPVPQRFPTRLEDLVKAPHISETRRFLRKLYKDPITNDDWVLVKVGDGIRGVHSRSEEAPLKEGNFPDEYKGFEGKTKYSEWVFEYTPQQVQPAKKPVPPPKQ